MTSDYRLVVMNVVNVGELEPFSRRPSLGSPATAGFAVGGVRACWRNPERSAAESKEPSFHAAVITTKLIWAVNVMNVGERCKLQCSPLKLLKSKARVNVVNVVQRFFASRARNPQPIPSARGYPRKVPGIHLGYPRQSLGFARGFRRD